MEEQKERTTRRYGAKELTATSTFNFKKSGKSVANHGGSVRNNTKENYPLVTAYKWT